MLLLSLLACKDTQDTASAPTLPDLPTDSCGAAYDWVPTEQMGQVVALEPLDGLSLTAGGINTLLAEYDLSDVVQARYDVQVFSLRYTTQDRGQVTEATALVSFPILEQQTQVPVLLWLHPTVGFSDACAPSGLGFEGAAFNNLWASQGYAVVSPDYLGMRSSGEASEGLHPYIVAEATAIASLDAVRALEQVSRAGATTAKADTSKLIHWGASEGGFAALWTDRYQPRYLPEYTSVAVVAAIPPTDLQALAVRGASTWSATTAGLGGALATMQQYYEGPPLSEILQPPLSTDLQGEMMASCSDFPSTDGLESVEQVYTPELLDALLKEQWTGLEDWQCYLQQGGIREAPFPRESTAPVMMVLAQDDDLAWAPAARDDITPLCEQGYVIEHLECAGADHVSGAVDTLALQLEFVARILDGGEVAHACEVVEAVDCEAL